MKNFIRAFLNEAAKHKGLATLYMVFLAPVAVVMVFTLYLAGGSETYSASANPWLTYYGYALYVLAIMYPVLFAVLGYSLQETEFRSNGYFRLFLFPVGKMTLYTAKSAFLLAAILMSLSLGLCSIVFSGIFLDWLEPRFGFADFNTFPTILYYFVRFIPFLFIIGQLFFTWSFYYHNLLVSLSLIFMLLLVGIFLGISSNYYWLFPGSWFKNVSMTVEMGFKRLVTTWLLTDIIWAVLLFVFGAIKFTRMSPVTASS
jgi:hypothetical protein